MAFEDFLISCTRKRPVYSSGNRKYIESYVDTTINGRLGRKRQREFFINGKQTSLTIINFLCDDFDLKESDRIEYENKIYEVVGEPQNTMDDHHIKSELKHISNIT